MKTSVRYLGASLRLLLVMTVILGVAYPLTVWGIGQLAFNDSANGSMVELNGSPVGSSLIGQDFAGPEWFQGRPSAGDYDALASGASNLAATSGQLLSQVEQRRANASGDNSVEPSDVPPDALTASGSGLDPHISPQYAHLQVARVADARGMNPADVTALVDEYTQDRSLGFLGEPRVNVLELNLALEQLSD
jgi:K+-transporting ATPase ATPase C chain